LIGEQLHFGAVGHHGQIVLVDVPELDTKVHGTRGLVVAEEAVDGTPQGVGRVRPGLDGAKQIGRDGAVEPRNDGVVVPHPVRCALDVGGVDVVEEAKLGEDGEEVEAPVTIVAGVELKNHGNMGLNVDHLDLRCRSWSGDDLRDVMLRRDRRRSRFRGRRRAHGDRVERQRKKRIASYTDTM
jgi:hypothetical protein